MTKLSQLQGSLQQIRQAEKIREDWLSVARKQWQTYKAKNANILADGLQKEAERLKAIEQAEFWLQFGQRKIQRSKWILSMYLKGAIVKPGRV